MPHWSHTSVSAGLGFSLLVLGPHSEQHCCGPVTVNRSYEVKSVEGRALTKCQHQCVQSLVLQP